MAKMHLEEHGAWFPCSTTILGIVLSVFDCKIVGHDYNHIFGPYICDSDCLR